MKNLLRKPPYQLPTILGLLFLLVSLFAGVMMVKSNQVFFLRANPDIIPREVKIANITDTSFVVSWITSGKTNGFVQIQAAEERVFADDRDQLSGQIGQFTTHYVTVKNLSPLQKYFFKLGSGGKMFDDEGKPFEVTTGSVVSQLSSLADPAYGRVETVDGKPAEGAIVYLSLPNVTSQSALVKASGNWLIALSSARNADLSGYASYDQQISVEEVFVQGGNLGNIAASFTTETDSPAPTLILGKSLDLTIPVSTPSPISSTSGFLLEITPSPVAMSHPEMELQISYPSEGEFVSTQRPEFSGQAPQNSVLTIILNSQGYFGQVASDEEGNWSWSPPENLEPGEHQLLIRYQDEQGQAKTVEHRFTVLAAGDSDLPSFTSTPSATPLPSATPTLPSRTTLPSTDSGIPRPGVLTPTFLISMMGIGMFVLGIFLRKRLGLICNWPN